VFAWYPFGHSYPDDHTDPLRNLYAYGRCGWAGGYTDSDQHTHPWWPRKYADIHTISYQHPKPGWLATCGTEGPRKIK